MRCRDLSWSVMLGLGLAAAGPAWAWVSPAPDVVVDCTPGLAPPLRELARGFTARTGVRVRLFLAPPAGLLGLVLHRARADVVLADPATLGTLAREGLLRPGSTVALGVDRFVLVARAGAAPGADAVYVAPDPTTAASFDGQALLRLVAPGHAALGVADTPDVVFDVLADPGRIGLVEASTAAGRTDLAVVARPADTLAPPVAVSGALTSNGQSGRAADFLSYVASADGRAILRAHAVEPLS